MLTQLRKIVLLEFNDSDVIKEKKIPSQNSKYCVHENTANLVIFKSQNKHVLINRLSGIIMNIHNEVMEIINRTMTSVEQLV